MAHQSCRWRLAAPTLSHHALPLRQPSILSRTFTIPFTTTSNPQMPLPPKPRTQQQLKAMPARGEKRTFQKKKKKGLRVNKGNPPAPGERKAYKKRVVLSNVNALEVAGLADLEEGTALEANMQGTIMGLPGPLVDRLRALGAFKPTQSWGMFKRPATLIRPETLEIANVMSGETESNPTQRLILTGERGSGKSVLLLQAQALALLKDWVVITIPDAWDVVSARTDYGPIADSKPVQYHQKTYMTQLLARTAQANPILSTLPIESTQTRSLPHSETLKTLGDLCKSAAADPEQAWPIFQALWNELTLAGRPPVLVSLDGLPHAMRHSLYRSASFELIHAHDLALINWFMTQLSGATPLPNGGLVLAAMSYTSTDLANRTLDERVAQLEAEQALAKGDLAHDPEKDPVAAFLAATGQESSPIPRMDPYVRHDARVLDILGRGRGLIPASEPLPRADAKPARKNTKKNEATPQPESTALHAPITPVTPVGILRCNPLDRPAAQALMEYWARSGMLRAEVTPRLVNREWALAGGGVLGELERGVLKKNVLSA